MEEENAFKTALSHTIGEMELPNVSISLRGNYVEIQRAHDAIHEFLSIAPLCLPARPDITWHQKSAFFTYQFEAFYQAHRSFLEALSGYYNTGYVLLRSVLELLLKGSFYECLAHKKFRNRVEIPCKPNRRKKTPVDWIDALIEEKPSIENDLEATSASIFDKLGFIFKDSELREKLIYLPTVRQITEQLSYWKMFSPIPNPVALIYRGLYSALSENVHVLPDETDIGRRILSKRGLFETVVMPRELSKFMAVLHLVIDVGTVVELNLLSEWIEQSEEAKTKLRERLQVLNELRLTYGMTRLRSLLNKESR